MTTDKRHKTLQRGKEAGMSLVEFIVYTALIVIVVVAAVSFMIFQIRLSRTTQEVIAVADNGRVIIEQITRDLQIMDASSLEVSGAGCASWDYAKDVWQEAALTQYPCIKFSVIEGGGELNPRTVQYYFDSGPPSHVYRIENGGAAEQMDGQGVYVENLGFAVYTGSSANATKTRITVILSLKTGDDPTAKRYVFQNTIFPDASYEIIPPAAP